MKLLIAIDSSAVSKTVIDEVASRPCPVEVIRGSGFLEDKEMP
jgi:hypothetical protein